MPFQTNQFEAELAKLAAGESIKSGAISLSGEDFDLDLETEIQTSKPIAKLLPCRECKRPLVVTTFFAPAKAVCGPCKGEGSEIASVGQPVPGQTDPAKAVDLTKTLVNHEFAFARCPVHPTDEMHEMKLISVTHNANYGPGYLYYDKGGKPRYKQLAPGETVMLQCQHEGCFATVTYSTTAVTRFRPMNESRMRDDAREHMGVNAWMHILDYDDPEPQEDNALDSAA